MSFLVVDAVSKRFGAASVLKGCSLSVDKGAVLTLLGPSGCGKTTLLRTIAGFVEPDAGRVSVGGRDLSALPPHRREVGYVFQNYALFPHLRVADNVGYGLRVRRIARREIARRVEEALALVDLTGVGARFPAQLSGGQQQRVAIARALVLEPALLLLDEPFNALDARLRATMQIELRKLIDRVGITSIFVTHDQVEAMTLSDKVAVMRDGAVEQLGTPLDVYDRPSTGYVADFVGRANLIRGTVRDGAFASPRPVPTGLPAGPAVLVARPENLALGPAGGPGWPGVVGFSTALGPTIEYEVDCGLGEPLRAVVARDAGTGAIPAGTAVSVGLRDAGAAVVLSAAARAGA